MANAVRGEVTFAADGRDYVLRWSTNAMCEIEEATGNGVHAVVRELMSWSPPLDAKGRPRRETPDDTQQRVSRIRIKLVRVVFWATLRDRHPEVTLREAGELMQQIGGMAEAMQLIAQAFERGAAPETKGPRPQMGTTHRETGADS